MPNALHLFTLGRIPVHANMWFGLILVFVGINQPGGLAYGLAAAAAVTITLLVHEFGHALVAQRYGLAPQILLHGIGGLCFHVPAKTDRHSAYVIIAGPALEIVFGLLIWVLLAALEAGVPDMIWQPVSDSHMQVTPLGHGLDLLVWFSVVWGVLNLIPIHPLDGGQLFRLWMRRKKRPVQAERVTHMVSIVIGIGGAIYGYTSGWWFVGIIAGLLAWSNWEALSALGMSHPVRKTSVYADALTKEAEAAFAAGQWYEAARLAHQVRDQANVHEKIQKRAFEIIVLSNVELENWEEAAGFVDHATPSPAIKEARRLIEEGLEREKADGW